MKEYVDTNAFTTAGGVVPGDIKLNDGSDMIRSLECNYLTAGKKFYTFAGDIHKYAIIFLTRFRITSSGQDKN